MSRFTALVPVASSVALALLLPACGSSGDDTASASEIASTCTTVAKSICDRISRCGVDYRFQRDYGSQAECNQQEKDRCYRQSYRPKTGHTMAYQKTCAKARDTQSCADFLNGAVLAACDTPVGPLKAGEACVDQAQCQSRYCRLGPTDTCGKCADKGAMGTMCWGSGDCQDAFYCNKVMPTDVTGTCAKRSTMGGACNPNLPCLAPDLVCAGYHLDMGTPVDGTCQPRTGKMGDACNDTKVCNFGYGCAGFSRNAMTDGTCVPLGTKEGDACNTATAAGCDGNYNLYCLMNVCTKRPLVATNGGCNILDPMTNMQASCSNGDSCVRPLDSTMMRPGLGTCTARVGLGSNCFVDGTDGPGCGPGLTCLPAMAGATTGKCAWRDGGMCLNTKSEPYMSMVK